MTLSRNLSFVLSAALAANLLGPVTLAQPDVNVAPATAPKPTATPPLTEESLRARLMGKTLFLRGFYMGDDLQFDEYGKVNGSPAVTSFTLSALEVRKIHLDKHKLQIEADRYGLHFFGALPNEDDSTKPYDKVRIGKKPIRITIARELVVIPKVKKDKNSKGTPAPQALVAGAKPQPGVNAPATAAPVVTAEVEDSSDAPDASEAAPKAPAPGVASAPAAGTPSPTPMTTTAETTAALTNFTAGGPTTTTSPAHSAKLLNEALDKIFADDVDKKLLAQLPDYWQQYFASKSQHKELLPGDGQVPVLGAGMTAPHVLNSIDPSSNEYAQKYGIAGLTLFRTVVDANGKPQQISIARPIGFGLDETAIDAIRHSHFAPAVQDGHPVPVVIDLVVTFRIYSNRTKPGSVPKGSKPTVLAASAAGANGSSKSVKMLH